MKQCVKGSVTYLQPSYIAKESAVSHQLSGESTKSKKFVLCLGRYEILTIHFFFKFSCCLLIPGHRQSAWHCSWWDLHWDALHLGCRGNHSHAVRTEGLSCHTPQPDRKRGRIKEERCRKRESAKRNSICEEVSWWTDNTNGDVTSSARVFPFPRTWGAWRHNARCRVWCHKVRPRTWCTSGAELPRMLRTKALQFPRK